jgi:hypothetical protein
MSKAATVNYQAIGSYCPVSSPLFAEAVLSRVIEHLEAYKGGNFDVGGYTPPYDEDSYPAGFLALTLTKGDLPLVRIGIEFGRLDVDGELVREAFDPERWLEEPFNPHEAGIYAANFDEAWRVVCLLGSHLIPTAITLSYGC